MLAAGMRSASPTRGEGWRSLQARPRPQRETPRREPSRRRGDREQSGRAVQESGTILRSRAALSAGSDDLRALTRGEPPENDRVPRKFRGVGQGFARSVTPVLGSSGASRSSNVLGEQIVDEGLIAQPSTLGLAPHSVENLGIDPNGNQSPGLGTQRRSPHASHRSQLGGGNLRNFGEVYPGTPPCTPLALSGSPGAC
jgi:hypothetical protein